MSRADSACNPVHLRQGLASEWRPYADPTCQWALPRVVGLSCGKYKFGYMCTPTIDVQPKSRMQEPPLAFMGTVSPVRIERCQAYGRGG